MEWLDLLHDIFKVCVIPMLGILTTFLIKWLKAKEIQILDGVDSEIAAKYVSILFETITDCVSATTQTYVDEMKKNNAFDADAQKVAFQKSFDAVVSTLTEDAKECLSSIYGDLNAFIATKIEAEVKAQKV